MSTAACWRWCCAAYQELELSDTVTGLVAGLPFALCYALCAIPIAWVADNHNRRNLLAGALAFWSAVTALAGSVRKGGSSPRRGSASVRAKPRATRQAPH